MIYAIIIGLLLIDIIIFLYSYHAQKSEKSGRELFLRNWQNQNKDINQIKLELSALRFTNSSHDNDVNSWVNAGKDNHREIIKLNELQKNVSARLNHLITVYQTLEKEVNTLRK